MEEEKFIWDIGGKARGKELLGKPKRGWVHYIKTGLRKI
jgi:hypothetical protein